MPARALVLIVPLALVACATGPDGHGSAPAVDDVAPSADLRERAARALLDADVVFPARADVAAPLDDQFDELTARLEGAVSGDDRAALLLERAGVLLGLAAESEPEDAEYYLAVALQGAEDAAFAFGDGTRGCLGAYFLIGRIHEARGEAEIASDFYGAILAQLG